MKSFLLVIFLFIGIGISYSQKVHRYKVTYQYVHKMNHGGLTSMVDSLQKSGAFTSDSSITIDNLKAEDIFGGETIEMTITCLASKDSSILSFATKSNEKGKLMSTTNTTENATFTSFLNSPDTSIYTAGKWMSLADGQYAEIPTYKLDFQKTIEKKAILGYSCYRVVAKQKKDNSTVHFWATDELPSTVTSYRGVTNFPFAILEWENPSRNILSKAIKIEPL